MSFADLEARANAAVMRRLANARALKAGAAEDFPVVFGAGYVQGFEEGGVDGVVPRCKALASDVAAHAIVTGTELSIGGTTYYVRSPQPDGTGMVTLLLTTEALP